MTKLAPLPKEALQRVTGGTRVIISFGTRKGGFELTNQLRMDIMRRYGRAALRRDARGVMQLVETDPSFCYLDAVTLDRTPGASWQRPTFERAVDGKKKAIELDEWQSRNSYWNVYYPSGMSHAAVIVYLITRPWLESKFCIQELAWYVAQCLRIHGRTACVFVVWNEAIDEFRTLLDQLAAALLQADPAAYPFFSGEKYELLRNVFKEAAVALPAGSQQLLQRRAIAGQLVARLRHSVMEVPQLPAIGAVTATYYYDAQDAIVRPSAANMQRDANGHATGPRGAAWQHEHQFDFNYAVDDQFEQRLFRKLDTELRPMGIVPRPG